MQYNVAQLLKSSPGEERRYTLQETDQRIKELAGEVHGEVRLIRTDRSIVVMGHLETAIGCECSRCLNSVIYPLGLEIEEEFYPTIDVTSGVPLGTPPDGSFMIDSHHILDLGEAVRQYAIINSPMKPLCDRECAGFCASCGANLNQIKCGCPQVTVDHRWAKLAGLKAVVDKHAVGASGSHPSGLKR